MQLVVRCFMASALALLCQISFAASDLSEAFDIMWEMQWQQSGYPLNARKWDLSKERKLTYSISVDASKSATAYVQQALIPVGVAAGVEFVQVEEKEAKAQIEFSVRRFSDEELRAMPCYTNSPYQGWFFYQTKVTLAEQQAWRCAIHEMMHVMGFVGHPLGDTILTYFGGNRSKLSEIDQFVLKHWNSDLITPGMNVFRLTKTLNEQWISDKVPKELQASAQATERQWFAQTIEQMDSFADGRGEPPRILYRSGRISADGLTRSRLQIQGILGVAYLEGYGVDKNPVRASVLLLRGAQGGASGAITALMRGLMNDKFAGADVKALCAWVRDAPLANGLTQVLKDETLAVKSCQ
jgi:hypothetical protein